jgi:hypothetical protein
LFDLPAFAACVIAGASITCTWPEDVAPTDSKVVQVLATVGTTSPLTITSTVTTDTAGVAPATQTVTVSATVVRVCPACADHGNAWQQN